MVVIAVMLVVLLTFIVCSEFSFDDKNEKIFRDFSFFPKNRSAFRRYCSYLQTISRFL